MPTCFVIQPFDNGRFDKRYRDVLAPAIEAAGLEPYRVDRDPGASVVIDEIESRIRDADVCLADITTNNPNVWFELGFALASRKEVCLICSDERTDRYPFDVQHRLIIKYFCESPSDFENLRDATSQRLKALQSKQRRLERVASSPLKETEGLSQHEIVTLCAIMENRTSSEDAVTLHQLIDDMRKMGYNRLAVNLSVEKLLRKDLIEIREGEDYDQFSGQFTFKGYALTALATNWLIENEDKLNLQEERPSRGKEDFNLDDEIRF